MNVTIYRIEDRVGLGPFAGDHVNKVMANVPAINECPCDMPGPYSDVLMRDIMKNVICEDYSFGFLTLEQYFRAFPLIYRREFRKSGQLRLSIYKIPAKDVIGGYYQCAFIKGKHKPVIIRPLPIRRGKKVVTNQLKTAKEKATP